MKEELKDFIADVVTDDRWSPITLARLFALPPATWVAVPTLCDGLADAAESYQRLVEDDNSEVMAMWLPHPDQPEQASLVLFYLDAEMSSTVSLVTRDYLQRIMPGGITIQG